MILKIIVYIIFYVSVFLLGFFGITPILILNSIEDKIPYIILVALGYPVLIALLVLSYKKGLLKTGYKKIGKGLKVTKQQEIMRITNEEKIETKDANIEVDEKNEVEDQDKAVHDEVEVEGKNKEDVKVVDEEDVKAKEKVEYKVKVIDKEAVEDKELFENNTDIDVEALEDIKVLDLKNT